jgi:Ca2+-binding EF-hand superfamily protein
MAERLVQQEDAVVIKNIYREFDKSGDGKLQKTEIREGYSKHFGLALSDDALDGLISELDLDGNGVIDYPEFLGAIIRKRR